MPASPLRTLEYDVGPAVDAISSGRLTAMKQLKVALESVLTTLDAGTGRPGVVARLAPLDFLGSLEQPDRRGAAQRQSQSRWHGGPGACASRTRAGTFVS